ncbi:MAG: DUF5131 family protein [Ignavibacteria bacterium]|nr:DUF5131 family protein [Ignavibacteria bacterium]
MSSITKIGWTGFFGEKTGRNWNCITGCTFDNIDCLNCYAMWQSNRWAGVRKAYEGVTEMSSNGLHWTGKINLNEDELSFPLHRKQPTAFFVNSMSDMFHKDVPFEFIQKMFDVMNKCRQHIFQILSKRSDRLLELSPQLNWTENIWMGVSVGHEESKYKIDDLRKTDANIKFLSLEPLTSPLSNIDYSGIRWVIVGAESGHNARYMDLSWVRDILKDCRRSEAAFYMKQICRGGKKIPLDEFPQDLQVWEYPIKQLDEVKKIRI